MEWHDSPASLRERIWRRADRPAVPAARPILSIFALALPALLVMAATGGMVGVQDLLRRILRWRVGVHSYLVALFGLLLATLLGAIPLLGVVPLEALAQNWGLLFTVFLPGVLVPFVFANLWEETGWTEFMQHTLQERHEPLLASLMVTPASRPYPSLLVSAIKRS